MKIVVMEPLGVAEETLRQQAEELLGKDAALCLYDSPAKDAAELVERGVDADVIVIANEAVICGLTPEKACNFKEFAA